MDVNFDLVKVHWSISSLEPGVNHAKVHYVLAVIEEEPVESTVVLKVDLPPYVDIGAVRVPQTLTKRRLIMQTGLRMVCGPGGEVCACYDNGYELLSGEEATAYVVFALFLMILNFLIFCIDSWGSVLGHIVFFIIWVFEPNFAVADSRPALLYF